MELERSPPGCRVEGESVSPDADYLAGEVWRLGAVIGSDLKRRGSSARIGGELKCSGERASNGRTYHDKRAKRQADSAQDLTPARVDMAASHLTTTIVPTSTDAAVCSPPGP